MTFWGVAWVKKMEVCLLRASDVISGTFPLSFSLSVIYLLLLLISYARGYRPPEWINKRIKGGPLASILLLDWRELIYFHLRPFPIQLLHVETQFYTSGTEPHHHHHCRKEVPFDLIICLLHKHPASLHNPLDSIICLLLESEIMKGIMC